MDTRADFLRLLNYGLALSVKVRGASCTRVQEEASGFLKKQLLHAYSVWHILNPQPRKEISGLAQGAILPDFATTHCIIRIMFELHVNMWNVTSNFTSEAEGNMWLDMWDLHSEYKRWELVRSSTSLRTECETIAASLLQRTAAIRAEIEHIQLSVKQAIESKISAIEENVRSNDPKARSYRHWKSDKTVIDMAMEEGYHAYHARRLYVYGSQYVHSYAYSLSQVLGADRYEDYDQLLNTAASDAAMLLSLTLKTFWNVYPSFRTLLPPDDELVELVHFYNRVHSIDLNDLEFDEPD